MLANELACLVCQCSIKAKIIENNMIKKGTNLINQIHQIRFLPYFPLSILYSCFNWGQGREKGG